MFNINHLKINKMKTSITHFIFAASLSIAFTPKLNASETSCSDLFISEIMFSKINNENSFNLNHAIELFNSSDYSINLSTYSVVLITDLGVHTTINLSGTILSHETYVLTNSNAALALQALSDQLSTDFNLENNAFLELRNNANVLDKIGQTGTNGGALDLQQLAADPYNYLLGRGVNLDDFHDITLRRGLFVTEGDPTFLNGGSMFGKWGYSINNLTGDIGQHKCLCNRESTNAMIGWLEPEVNVGESNAANETDLLLLNINGASSANTNITQTGVTIT
jgi:hypothetical protein